MNDNADARRAMVDCQVRPSDVTNFGIIQAMLDVPRDRFVPAPLRGVAYSEAEIALGEGRMLLPPRTFAKMLEAAQIEPGDLVLDLAPGTGYGSAVLSHLATAVISVEPDQAMAAQANTAITALEIDNVVISAGDPTQGDAAHGPFDVIFVNGAVAEVPAALTDQLKVGGRLVAIVADGGRSQCRVLVRGPATVSSRFAFDASAPILPGFEKASAFAF